MCTGIQQRKSPHSNSSFWIFYYCWTLTRYVFEHRFIGKKYIQKPKNCLTEISSRNLNQRSKKNQHTRTIRSKSTLDVFSQCETTVRETNLWDHNVVYRKVKEINSSQVKAIRAEKKGKRKKFEYTKQTLWHSWSKFWAVKIFRAEKSASSILKRGGRDPRTRGNQKPHSGSCLSNRKRWENATGWPTMSKCCSNKLRVWNIFLQSEGAESKSNIRYRTTKKYLKETLKGRAMKKILIKKMILVVRKIIGFSINNAELIQTEKMKQQTQLIPKHSTMLRKNWSDTCHQTQNKTI